MLHRFHTVQPKWLPVTRVDLDARAKRYVKEDEEAAAKAKSKKRKPAPQ